MGGPPCQGMSLAGKRLSDDPRNLLFKTFVEVVKITKPQCFLMENVTGLLSFENGKINHAIINSFKEIGYDTFNTYSPTIMKAEMYGVPQIRRRLFYVGFKNKVNKLVWPPKPLFREYSNKIINNYNLFDDNEDIPSPYTVSDAISDLPILKAGEGEDEVSYNSLKKIKNEFQKDMRDWSLCPRKNIEKKLYNHVSPNNTIDLIHKIFKKLMRVVRLMIIMLTQKNGILKNLVSPLRLLVQEVVVQTEELFTMIRINQGAQQCVKMQEFNLFLTGLDFYPQRQIKCH